MIFKGSFGGIREDASITFIYLDSFFLLILSFLNFLISQILKMLYLTFFLFFIII